MKLQKIDLGQILPFLLAALLSLSLSACADSDAVLPDVSSTSLQRDTIRVNGVGEASGKPDIAFVELGVEQQGEQVGDVVQEANQALQAVTAALVETGIPEEDIQTTRFNVDQRAQRDPETGLATGEPTYVVRAAQRVKIEEVEQIGAVIQTTLDAGANNVFGLQFDLADPSALQKQARTAAVDDARARAEDLAQALGVEVGEPLYVSELSAGSPLTERPEALAAGAGAGPPIEAGQLTVSVQVEVVFELEG